MSYCRWSTDDFKCDLYIYESVYDCWTIHVAGSRYPDDMPPSPSLLDLCENRVTMAEYRAMHDARDAFMEGRAMVAIDLPHAGETFNLPTPGECADKVEELVALGFHCPDYVAPALREEQVELDASGTEARQGGDCEAGSVHDGPVRDSADAQTPPVEAAQGASATGPDTDTSGPDKDLSHDRP